MASRSPSRLLWVAVIAVILVVILVWPLTRSLAERSGLWLFQPVIRAGNWLRAIQPSSDTQRLRTERDDLLRQLNSVSLQLRDANERLSLIEAIAALDQFAQASKLHLLQAPVIAFSPDPGIQSVVIGQGSDHGVQIGQAVVTNDGVVVGKVVQVHQSISTVLLTVDRQSAFAARIQNATQSLGVVKGERGLALRMEFIPKNDTVTPGQAVVTAGSEQGIPPDLLIGTIQQPSIRAGELFQNSTVTTSIDVQRLQVVAVVTP